MSVTASLLLLKVLETEMYNNNYKRATRGILLQASDFVRMKVQKRSGLGCLMKS